MRQLVTNQKMSQRVGVRQCTALELSNSALRNGNYIHVNIDVRLQLYFYFINHR
jgi:hypothetical protein